MYTLTCTAKHETFTSTSKKVLTIENVDPKVRSLEDFGISADQIFISPT